MGKHLLNKFYLQKMCLRNWRYILNLIIKNLKNIRKAQLSLINKN